MVKPVFAAEGVGRRFGRRAVLCNASAWAHAGTISAVLGCNGCGKSTLLRIAAGRLRLDHGVVHMFGQSFLRPRAERLARLGLYFLTDDAALPWTLSVRQAADWMAGANGAGSGADALAQLGLEPLQDARPHELSGGEQRLAAMALALVRGPRVLLADEPFAGMSPLHGELIAEALRLLARRGCAIIVTGHEVPELLRLAGDVVWMTAGTTHALGTPAAARAHDQFRREYLGPWSSGAAALGAPVRQPGPAPEVVGTQRNVRPVEGRGGNR